MDVEGCRLPDDRLYDFEDDVWLRWPAAGEPAEFGVVSHLAAFAGRFTGVTFRVSTGRVHRGEAVAILESVRFTGAVRAPVDGELLEVNLALTARPKVVNDDPYAAGWVARLRPEPTEVPPYLESAERVAVRIAQRIAERKVVCRPAVPDVELIEVGAECATILARLDDELKVRAVDDVVLLVTDDPTSPIELVRWSDRTGYPVLDFRKEGNLNQFLIRKVAEPKPRRPASPRR